MLAMVTVAAILSPRVGALQLGRHHLASYVPLHAGRVY